MALKIDEKRTKIRDLIHEANSQFISVDFIKKDGSERSMQIQFAAGKNHLVEEYQSPSTEQAVKTRKENHPELMSVWDVAKKEYRSINLDTVFKVVSNGVTYQFKLPDDVQAKANEAKLKATKKVS